MRIARFIRAFYFCALILFLCLPLELHAQTEGKEYVADFFQCSIEAETQSWSQGRPIFVVVQLKNVSGEDANLLGIYSFELRGVPPAPYWSPVNILSGTPLELETESEGLTKGGGRAPKGAIHLEAGETKAMRFDLSKLLWNKSFSSIWPYQKLFEVVPKGNYDLIFDVETDRRKNPDNIPYVTHKASNSVRIVVE